MLGFIKSVVVSKSKIDLKKNVSNFLKAFEIFLKDHVGGLFTVYAKLKRLDMHPITCNTDQVLIFVMNTLKKGRFRMNIYRMIQKAWTKAPLPLS